MRPLSALASFVGMACLAAACGGEAPAPDTSTSAPEAGTAAAAPPARDPAAPAADYPALYRELQLPILPGGEVEDTGRQTTSLRDGLSLRVMSPDMSVDEVREYYSTRLAAGGWDEAPSRVLPGMPMAGVQATKDGVTFTATISADPDRTRIQLTVVER